LLLPPGAACGITLLLGVGRPGKRFPGKRKERTAVHKSPGPANKVHYQEDNSWYNERCLVREESNLRSRHINGAEANADHKYTEGITLWVLPKSSAESSKKAIITVEIISRESRNIPEKRYGRALLKR
jgi:hypothetical protein